MTTNYPALTSLRGIAAWWVVMYHFRELLNVADHHGIASLLAHGYLAVDLFFIMSGFVIALHYGYILQSPTRAKILRFLGLRIARIYPLHLVILLVFLVNPLLIHFLSHTSAIGDRYNLLYFMQSLILVQNWGFSPGPAWNIPAWSISAEWGAYLLFPALAWGHRNFSSLHAVIVCAALVFGAITGIGYLVGSLGDDIAGFGLARCLIEFSLGSLLFRANTLTGRHSAFAFMAFPIGVTLLTIGSIYNWHDFLYAPLSLLLIISSLLDNKSLFVKILAQPILLYIGEISYSTYLIHYLIKDWVKFLLVGGSLSPALIFMLYLFLIAAASTILYRFIEMPGRRFGRAVTERLVQQRAL